MKLIEQMAHPSFWVAVIIVGALIFYAIYGFSKSIKEVKKKETTKKRPK